ncbi:kinetochore-associated protein NSL1 homolog [Mixophyes fleayi]|uniref:kinetochore-associated protein NSL1 homolog n=1 Tax=Mixophyes fleayi TaxID=3061075 RepID=UPI003F4D7CE7
MAANVDSLKRRSLRLLGQSGAADHSSVFVTPVVRASAPRTRLSGGNRSLRVGDETRSGRNNPDRSWPQKRHRSSTRKRAEGNVADRLSWPEITGPPIQVRTQSPKLASGDNTNSVHRKSIRQRRSTEGSHVNERPSQVVNSTSNSGLVLGEAASPTGTAHGGDGPPTVTRTTDYGVDEPSTESRATDHQAGDGPSAVTRATDHQAGDGPSTVTRATDHQAGDGPSSVTRATDYGVDGPSTVTRATDHQAGDGPSTVTRATDHQAGDGPSTVTRATDHQAGDGPSTVTRATDHQAGDGPSTVTRGIDHERPGTSMMTRGADDGGHGPFKMTKRTVHEKPELSSVTRGSDHEGAGQSTVTKGTDYERPGTSMVTKGKDLEESAPSMMTKGTEHEESGPSRLWKALDREMKDREIKKVGSSIETKVKDLEEAGPSRVCKSVEAGPSNVSVVRDNAKMGFSRLSLSKNVEPGHCSPMKHENPPQAGLSCDTNSGSILPRDYKVHCCSKQLLQEVLGMCSEIGKEVLESQQHLSQVQKKLEHKNYVWDFETSFQENISINGQSWHEAPDTTESEPDMKRIEDQLDDVIVESALKRKRYPRKILSHFVKVLKVEREVLDYKPVVHHEEIRLDSAYESSMMALTTMTANASQQISETMKALPVQLEKAEGFSQVLNLQPVLEGSRLRRDIFSSRVVLEDLAKTFPKLLETTPRESAPQTSTAPALTLKRRKNPPAQNNLYPLSSKRKISLDA